MMMIMMINHDDVDDGDDDDDDAMHITVNIFTQNKQIRFIAFKCKNNESSYTK